ncbi:Hsp33 family molecular chaperone HslO [Leptothoe kymatousa]|uniref:33 kDa chaperonin n=1 Tax=Leptothoe kymatousa TAU-MAC 1615 TaxID=2364775 RepID=A0ABS5Y408_9CYAN|nr:Hsp33 family molecular chaperone HslO [Leptothoe kymatousa]MBT9312570.1 Hsp33 family molecular chaperone HslO [Leptothoe kymatousa TAU-MAC 1615]
MADQLIRAVAADGGIRIVGAITTRLVEEARTRHKLSYVATAALGRTLTAGALLVSSMKREDSRINIQVQGDGPLGGILVDARLDGTVRGYVSDPSVELPPNQHGKLDVGAAVGRNGYVYVVRDSGLGYPYSSTVELVTGEIGDDLTQYLATSEQTPSALVLGVFVDHDGVEAAGGMLLQVLPKAARDEQLITALESRLSALTGFTPMLRAKQTLPRIFEDLVGDMGLQIFPESQLLRFHCSCDGDRMLSALKLLGEDELQDMINKQEPAEAICHFCGDRYEAKCDRLADLLAELKLENANRA